MPRAAKSTSKPTTKKPSTRKPKAPPPPPATTVFIMRGGLRVEVGISRLIIGDREVPIETANNAVAILLRKSLAEAGRP